MVSNTTPMPPNIRPDPKKTKRKSCIGPGKSIICKEINKLKFFHDLIEPPGKSFSEKFLIELNPKKCELM